MSDTSSKKSFQPKEFNIEFFTVGVPVRAEGDHDYCTLSTNYKGNGSTRFYTTTPMQFSPLKPNPKRLGRLGTGCSITDPNLEKMCDQIETKVMQKLFDERNTEGLPKAFKSKLLTDPKLIADLIPRTKRCLHRALEKDAKGNTIAGKYATGVAPRLYLDLIQKSDGSMIYTKFKSAQVLNPDVAAKIKNGKAKIADYTFDPKQIKSGFEGLAIIELQDLYVSESDVKFRWSLQEVFITKFTTQESEGERNLREFVSEVGVVFDNPGPIPTVDDSNVEETKIGDNKGKGESDEEEFTVEVNS